MFELLLFLLWRFKSSWYILVQILCWTYMLGCFLLVHGLLLYVLQGIFREQKGYTCIYSIFCHTGWSVGS